MSGARFLTSSALVGVLACTSDLRERLDGHERLESSSNGELPDAGGTCNVADCEISTDAGLEATCASCERDGSSDPLAPTICASGTWDHDGDRSTQCQQWTPCSAGQHVQVAGSEQSDQTCAPCPPETYSEDPNQISCTAWTSCSLAESELRSGTPTSDRICTPYCAETDAQPPSMDCLLGGPCDPGEEFIATGTDAGQAACRSCQPGRHCAGGTSSARSCPEGTWDHDADPATPCRNFTQCLAGSYISKAGSALVDRECEACASGTFSAGPDSATCTVWRSCEPGTFVVSAGSNTKDVECAGCPAGSFSRANDAESCVLWTNCEPGTYVSVMGSAMNDRECTPCPANTHSEGLNVGNCVAAGECAPGTVRLTPPTDAGLAPTTNCSPCEPGNYCAGADAEALQCSAGTWDEDHDPATPCSPMTVCVEGEHVASPGDPLTDRQCVACPDAEFSASINAESCEPWQVCAAGTFTAEPGSSVADRVCEVCPTGYFSSTEDAPSCTAWSTCAAPTQYVTDVPNATSDRLCDACVLPEESLVDNAERCVVPVFQMSDGTVAFEAEHYHELATNDSEHTWELTNDELASGEETMRINPEYGYQWTAPVGYAPQLSFRVNFTTTGTFYLNLRGDACGGGDGSDSCFLGVDEAPATVYDFDDAAGVFGWRQQTLSVATTGNHVVSIWASEDGFCVDKVVISSDAALPSDAGPPESPEG